MNGFRVYVTFKSTQKSIDFVVFIKDQWETIRDLIDHIKKIILVENVNLFLNDFWIHPEESIFLLKEDDLVVAAVSEGEQYLINECSLEEPVKKKRKKGKRCLDDAVGISCCADDSIEPFTVDEPGPLPQKKKKKSKVSNAVEAHESIEVFNVDIELRPPSTKKKRKRSIADEVKESHDSSGEDSVAVRQEKSTHVSSTFEDKDKPNSSNELSKINEAVAETIGNSTLNGDGMDTPLPKPKRKRTRKHKKKVKCLPNHEQSAVDEQSEPLTNFSAVPSSTNHIYFTNEDSVHPQNHQPVEKEEENNKNENDEVNKKLTDEVNEKSTDEVNEKLNDNSIMSNGNHEGKSPLRGENIESEEGVKRLNGNTLKTNPQLPSQVKRWSKNTKKVPATLTPDVLKILEQEVEKTGTVPVIEEPVPKPAASVKDDLDTKSNNTSLLETPHVGLTIKFKMVKLGPTYAPEISKDITAKITSILERSNLTVVGLTIFAGLEEFREPVGKYSVEADKVENTELSKYVFLKWSELIEPRIFPRPITF